MFVSLDIETTGLDKRTDRIIEFGAIKFDLEGHSENLQILINPGTKIPEFITYLTGITDEELKDAKPFNDVKDEIAAFIGDSIIVGHFVQFDIEFLREKGMTIENPYYDTSELARMFFPGLPSYSLEILSGIIGLTHEEKHRALDDSIAAQELFFKIIEQIESLPEKLHSDIVNIASKSSWKFAETLKEIKKKETEFKAFTPPLSLQQQNEEDKKILEIISSVDKTTFIETFNESQFLPEEIAKTTANTLILVPKDTFDITKDECKIADEEFHVSLSRLEEFKKKEAFSPPETTALIKTLVWVQSTKTGFLFEDLNLNPDEKQILRHIKFSEETKETEPFYKNLLDKRKDGKTIIAEHRYKITEAHYDKIVIFDTMKFIENLQARLTTYLDLKKTIEPIEDLNQEEFKNKLELIFAILENFVPKQISEYPESYSIQESDFASPNWQKICEIVQFLIQESQKLKDLVSPLTLPYLRDWKEILKELESIFIKQNLEDFSITVQKNRNNETFIRQIAKTKKIQEAFKEIKEKTDKIIFVGKSIDEGENGKFIKSLLNLTEEITIKKVLAPEEITKASQIFIANDIRGNGYDNLKETIDFIQKFLEKEKGQTVIIFNSGKKLDQTHQILAPKLKKEGINMFAQRSSGGAGKITEMYKKSPSTSSILVTPNRWETFDHSSLKENEDFKTIIIHCLPFDPPSDVYINALSSGFRDQWNDFGIPSAILQLKKIIGKFLYKTPGRIIILDSRIIEKSYSKEFMAALNEFATPTQLSSLSLLKIL